MGEIISIHGKAKSGKDTMANYICEYLDNKGVPRHRTAFADPIKKIAMEIFGFSWEQMHDPKLKEVKDSYWGISPREFMTMVGTEMFQKMWRKDVWVRVMERMTWQNAGKVFVITDVRYDHEAEWTKPQGVLIEVKRKKSGLKGKTAKHSSEAGITVKPHVVIRNDGTLRKLRSETYKVMKKIVKRKGGKDGSV